MPSPAASAMEVLSRHGLPATRQLIRRMHVGLDKAALAACPDSEDLKVQGAEGELCARLYRPESASVPGPLLVFFHGGGFVLCDLDSHDALCRRLAAKAGMRVLSVDYRLAPEHRFPAMHRDAEAAYRWAVANAGRLGADPARIGLGGDSAGAHMALWMALNGEDRPAFLALLYPLLDVNQEEWVGNPLKDLRFLGGVVIAYIRSQIEDFTDAGGSMEQFRMAGRDLSYLPPTVLAEVGVDPLRPGIHAFGEQMKAAGVKVEHLSFPTLPHGAFNFAYLSKQAAAGLDETAAAVRRAAEG